MGERKNLPVKSDVVFRMLFADEKNVDLLTGFLKSVLRLPEDEYSDIVITDPYLLPEYAGEKLAIIVFYDAKLVTEQLSSGGNCRRGMTGLNCTIGRNS